MDKSTLSQVIVDQSKQPLPASLVPRSRYEQLLPLVNNKQVIILSGIRRCGKSTLLQQLRLEQVSSDYFINFDDDRLLHFKVEDFQLLYEVFIELYGEQHTFYFDEIQNIKGWERFIRRLHNEGKKVFITGSNASLLSSELGTHLTGRHISLQLYPYSFKEFVASRKSDLLNEKKLTTTQIALLKKELKAYKKLGGMPEYLEKQQKEYLHALYENILYRDIIVRNRIPNEKPIKELVHYLASNNTKTFSYNSLRKLIGLGSTNTVAEYCHFLENSYLCFSLSRFSYSLKRQIHHAKKIYFIDQALAESVGFRFTEDSGRTLENIVFLQLLRQGKEIYFHKEKKECDFVLRDGYSISHAIQVCVDLTDPKTRQREMNGLLEAMQSYELDHGLIITEDERDEEVIQIEGKEYHIKVVPCWEWLLQTQ